MLPAYMASIGTGSVSRMYAMRVCRNDASIRPDTLIATAPIAMGTEEASRRRANVRPGCGCGDASSCAAEMPSPHRLW